MKHLLSAVVMIVVLAVATQARAGAPSTTRDQRVAIDVTSKGFQPSTVHARAGRPIVLVVTRKTQKTCATELVMKDQKIRKTLPLGQPVEIRLVAQKPGTLHYACGMDMIAGTLVID